MMAHLGTLQDRAYYTYDTGRNNDDWYAQGTVGVYLRPGAEDSGLIIRNQRLIETVLGQFLPAQVRAVFIIECVDREYVYTYDFPNAESQRHIEEKSFDSTLPETYLGLRDTHRDHVPGWIWIHSWSEAYSQHRIVALIEPTPGEPPIPINTEFRTWHIGLEQEERE